MHQLRRCLDPSTLERLRKVSWSFLRQLVRLVREGASGRPPEVAVLFRHPDEHLLLSSSSSIVPANHEASSLASARAEHDKSFEAFVAKGIFCEIDLEKLFRDEEFTKRVLV